MATFDTPAVLRTFRSMICGHPNAAHPQPPGSDRTRRRIAVERMMKHGANAQRAAVVRARERVTFGIIPAWDPARSAEAGRW